MINKIKQDFFCLEVSPDNNWIYSKEYDKQLSELVKEQIRMRKEGLTN